MNRLLLLRLAIWVLPAASLYALLLTRKRSRPLFAAVVLGLLWNAAALLAINVIALRLEWWSFHQAVPAFMEVAIEPWVGWTILWTAVSLLAEERLVAPMLLAVGWLDLLAMPLLQPLVVLDDSWLVGEMLSLVCVFVPGLLLVRWTLHRTHLKARLSLQIICASLLLLWIVPSVALGQTSAWDSVFQLPTWRFGIILQLVLIPAILGVRAAIEFAEKGQGTPLPYDPPSRVVTSGPYSYVRNPMQLSMVLIFLVGGIVLWNGWLLAAAFVAFVYGAGLAEWHEDVQLFERFNDVWTSYRASVRAWVPRWRPAVSEPSTLLVAYSCGTCSSIGRWFLTRDPVGLEIAAAEDSNDPELRRVTYVPADGPSQRGVIAIARALEHIHLGWAIVGWVLATPVVSHFAQLVVDVFGPTPHAVAGLPYDTAACSIQPEHTRTIASAKAH
ncbi:MAG: isoprenylcysteine carboxylmethyltransferase family protein [Actinobacteria bacterium]|nr:isoprenylcysteine carboxylmethyltransferase family protein [Actinomycetota bacterium]